MLPHRAASLGGVSHTIMRFTEHRKSTQWPLRAFHGCSQPTVCSVKSTIKLLNWFEQREALPVALNTFQTEEEALLEASLSRRCTEAFVSLSAA